MSANNKIGKGWTMMNWIRYAALGAALGMAACAPVETTATQAPAAAAPAPAPSRFGTPTFDTTPPELPAHFNQTAILVLSKTNGYRHTDAIAAANTMFEEVARARGWSIYFTENGAIANQRQLARFDAIVFNNVSGDVFTEEQRQAVRDYVEGGGGFVGIHGSGGDPSYAWDWYVQNLIGAQFIGHPMPPSSPQFQEATVHVEDNTHPSTRHLPENWVRTDEWYSFAESVRREGYHVLASLDESTYTPGQLGPRVLAMGDDHPIMWWHCEQSGRAFYSALGHRAETYADLSYRQTLEGAVAWAARVEGEGC